MEGFLYGQLDSEARFTGSDILFLYPDLVTGIRGSWREGVLLSGTAVEILAERCKVTLKYSPSRLVLRSSNFSRTG